MRRPWGRRSPERDGLWELLAAVLREQLGAQPAVTVLADTVRAAIVGWQPEAPGIAAVRALHMPFQGGPMDVLSCGHCNRLTRAWVEYPCQTILVLDAAVRRDGPVDGFATVLGVWTAAAGVGLEVPTSWEAPLDPRFRPGLPDLRAGSEIRPGAGPVRQMDVQWPELAVVVDLVSNGGAAARMVLPRLQLGLGEVERYRAKFMYAPGSLNRWPAGDGRLREWPRWFEPRDPQLRL